MKMTSTWRLLVAFGNIMLIGSFSLAGQDVKDSDGNAYKTARIGIQVWTARNLDVSHFRNGDIIPQAMTEEDWINAFKKSMPAWCYYENDTANGNKYGKLYNWYAINDPRGLVPEGWHVPANSDWKILVKNLLGLEVAGEKLKSKTEWKKFKGTDKIGFNGVPAGCRDSDGKFLNLGKTSQWWSNSVPVAIKPSENINSLLIDDRSNEVKYFEVTKGTGLSVRCVKD